MLKATSVVSFFGHEPGKAVFIGIYDMNGAKTVTREEIVCMADFQQLVEFGMNGAVAREAIQLFDLVPNNHLSDFKGRVIVSWPPPEIAWSRWANSKNKFEVAALYDDSILDRALPDWRELVLTWQQLQVMPMKLRAKLSEWRGVYFILDSGSGKGYVGSAYGKDNICGRWLNYRKTGHGNNKRLIGCLPQNLIFSILERVSPDLPPEEVIGLEQTWKARLHTREHGLNDN
ncbi:MAG: nuclease family protein [Schlesneria sp.]|nr:nuclease family protein [Schlesneria sp.]